MQGLSKIHIVIPTGGRPETIWSTLKSCTSQSYPNLRIWVCDNSFEPTTAEIVNELKDQRCRLIQPSRRLCMAENWEFALSHITDGLVSIIGDDDCLMPESIANVAALIHENPNISVINHLPASYYWPNFPTQDLANTLNIRPMDFKKQIVNTKPILAKVCAFESWYGHLPVLYHGFVSTKLLARIKQKSQGKLFNFCAPDIYAAIALAMHTDEFLMINSALTVGGQSARSSGANYALETEIGKKFVAELPINLHFRYESMSISLAVFEALENAFEYFPELQQSFLIDKQRLLQAAISEVSGLNDHHQKQLKEKLLLIYPAQIVADAFSQAEEEAKQVASAAEAPQRQRHIFIRGLGKLKSALKKKRITTAEPINLQDSADASSTSMDDNFIIRGDSIMLEQPLDMENLGIDCVEKASFFLQNKINELAPDRQALLYQRPDQEPPVTS